MLAMKFPMLLFGLFCFVLFYCHCCCVLVDAVDDDDDVDGVMQVYQWSGRRSGRD